MIQFPPPPPVVSALVISPNYARDGILLAGTVEDDVFSTSNRGRHWVACNFGLLDLNTICMAISPGFAHDETSFVGVDSGIFHSTNVGHAWREADFPLELAPVLSLALSPTYSNRQPIWRLDNSLPPRCALVPRIRATTTGWLSDLYLVSL